MNRVYRLVWSAVRSMWVVADELSKSCQKTGRVPKGTKSSLSMEQGLSKRLLSGSLLSLGGWGILLIMVGLAYSPTTMAQCGFDYCILGGEGGSAAQPGKPGEPNGYASITRGGSGGKEVDGYAGGGGSALYFGDNGYESGGDGGDGQESGTRGGVMVQLIVVLQPARVLVFMLMPL